LVYFISIIPVVYVWSLPILHGYFPDLINVGDVNHRGRNSISSHITFCFGTGLMAFSMFFPTLFMWESEIIKRKKNKH